MSISVLVSWVGTTACDCGFSLLCVTIICVVRMYVHIAAIILIEINRTSKIIKIQGLTCRFFLFWVEGAEEGQGEWLADSKNGG